MKQLEIMWFQQQFRANVDEEERSLWKLKPRCTLNKPDYQTNTETKPNQAISVVPVAWFFCNR
jgi:hypothetical protein